MTVVAHGLGATVAETRPLLSGTPGTKAYLEAAGHGRPFEGLAGYQPLADELLALADAHAADQALGVSLGAGALLRLLSQHPGRLARVVLHLPAALDAPTAVGTERVAQLADALAARDERRVEELVRQELPAVPGVERYVAQRTAFLLGSDLAPWLSVLPHDPPVLDRALLGAVRASVLVVAERDDPLHPLPVAEEAAEALADARLEVFGRGALWHERRRLRAVISEHLAGPSGPTASGRAADAPHPGAARQ